MAATPVINILLVEKDPGDVEFLSELLNEPEFNLKVAVNYDEAIAQLANDTFDIAIIDSSNALPECIKLLKEIHNSFSDLPCVLLSGFSNEELEAQTIRITSRYIIFKHRINAKVLRDTIYQAIEHQKLFNELETNKRSLEMSEQRFRTMIEKNVDVIVIFNRESEILYLNPTGKEVFGDNAEKLEHHIADFPVISGKNIMFSVKDEDEVRKYWEVRVVVVHWEGDACFLATIRDITDWKNAEREFRKTFIQLERSNKDLETFAYVASHDLQEPLRTVSGFMDLLKRKFGDELDEKALHYVNRSLTATARMQEMILSLLDYSRLTTQTQAFSMLDSGDILNQALENLNASIKERGAKITHDKLPEVWAEKSQLSRLFQNLIGNALKFCDKDNPEIHIGSEQVDEKIYKFSVSDNGIGIDPQFSSRIFMIFQRLERDKSPGTGIGLAMCKKIVEYHGGKIWVESKVGEGSTFYFTLSAKPKGGKS